MEIKKFLAMGVILLFIGVAVAPSINSSAVKPSDDLVEVTSQACGIQGFANTTVKLTKQQYQDLEQYLVEFRARLNQTSTREEAVPIFKDAVVELNKYGLLPKGMSVEKAQHLFQTNQVIPRSLVQERYSHGLFSNVFCYMVGTVPMWIYLEYGSFPSVWPLSLPILFSVLMARIVLNFQNLAYFFLLVAEFFYYQPFKLMNIVVMLSPGEIQSIGLKGKVEDNSTFVLLGFTGIILMQQEKVTLMGFSLANLDL